MHTQPEQHYTERIVGSTFGYPLEIGTQHALHTQQADNDTFGGGGELICGGGEEKKNFGGRQTLI